MKLEGDSNLVKSLAGEAAQQSKGREQRKYYQTQLNKSCQERGVDSV